MVLERVRGTNEPKCLGWPAFSPRLGRSFHSAYAKTGLRKSIVHSHMHGATDCQGMICRSIVNTYTHTRCLDKKQARTTDTILLLQGYFYKKKFLFIYILYYIYRFLSTHLIHMMSLFGLSGFLYIKLSLYTIFIRMKY